MIDWGILLPVFKRKKKCRSKWRQKQNRLKVIQTWKQLEKTGDMLKGHVKDKIRKRTWKVMSYSDSEREILEQDNLQMGVVFEATGSRSWRWLKQAWRVDSSTWWKDQTRGWISNKDQVCRIWIRAKLGKLRERKNLWLADNRRVLAAEISLCSLFSVGFWPPLRRNHIIYVASVSQCPSLRLRW